MKSNLRISAAIFVFILSSLAGSLAQAPSVPSTPQMFDPTTGMPIPSAPEWKDANWKDTNWIDPNVTLTNVTFDGPTSDIAAYLRDTFHNEFDIVLPRNWGSVVGTPQSGLEMTQDWGATPVSLQLKNVSASEIFNAMNLIFENDRVPLRWELKLNGKRRIALLRVLVDPVPRFGSVPTETLRRVYFVGNLIGDEMNGGMTMEQIIKTITDVWRMADASGGNIQFHKDAQLLVVTGTPGQIDFMEQTLKALTQKSEAEKIDLARRSNFKSIEDKMKTSESKSGSPGK